MSLEHSLKAMDEGRFSELIEQQQELKRVYREHAEIIFREVVAPALTKAFLYGTGRHQPLGIIRATR